jgi:hypothetical protein
LKMGEALQGSVFERMVGEQKAGRWLRTFVQVLLRLMRWFEGAVEPRGGGNGGSIGTVLEGVFGVTLRFGGADFAWGEPNLFFKLTRCTAGCE